jgi:hypothetical protein
MASANSIVTPNIFAKMTLFHLRSMNHVCRNMSTEVTSEFANKAMKVGDSVMVRRPYRFLVSEGLDFQPQPLQDTVMPVKVDTPLQIGFSWDSIEKTLSLREASELYAKPAAIALAAEINKRAAKYCAQNTPNFVGIPGTLPSTVDTFLGAGDKIVELGCPEGEELHLILNRKMSSAYVTARANQFNPQTEVSEQIKKGRIVDATLGYTINRDQGIYAHSTGTFAGTPLIDTNNQQADGGDNATMNIVLKGFTGGVSSMKKGDKFTIDGVYAVHPQIRQNTGSLKQFTLTADAVENAGAMTVNVFPAITPGGQYQNVTAAALTNAAIYFWAGNAGSPAASSGKVSPQALVMHKNAFAFVSVEMAQPAASSVEVVSSVKDPETGLAVSFIRAFDPRLRIWINRFDCLIGLNKLYAAELSCVLAG